MDERAHGLERPSASRTGRPVRRSTRYGVPGRQSFHSMARMVESFNSVGASPVYRSGTGRRRPSRRISRPRSRQAWPPLDRAGRDSVNQISTPAGAVVAKDSSGSATTSPRSVARGRSVRPHAESNATAHTNCLPYFAGIIGSGRWRRLGLRDLLRNLGNHGKFRCIRCSIFGYCQDLPNLGRAAQVVKPADQRREAGKPTANGGHGQPPHRIVQVHRKERAHDCPEK